ncbi:MAG TPA: MgtC/SapB family protein [Anaeromyxobacteraceae bacterium]|nr:MgtC/SapB family protein [Anaeromyxobacteraceae bacterium]
MHVSLAEVAWHMLAALAAGAVIGTERSIHGRAAGFRTHTLVCMSASLLMLITVFESQWVPATSGDSVRIDPTRMAQGIMTGIGFLGAGVIFKEGITVRGLTTAASIWTTSAIGILMGTGLYAAGTLATVLTLGVLSIFRLIELRFPTQLYARHMLRFQRGEAMTEAEIRALLTKHGFKISDLSYAVLDSEQAFEYRMAISTLRGENMARLADTLQSLPRVRAFSISPSGD